MYMGILVHGEIKHPICYTTSNLMHTKYFMKQAPVCTLLSMTVDVPHVVAKFGDTT